MNLDKQHTFNIRHNAGGEKDAPAGPSKLKQETGVELGLRHTNDKSYGICLDGLTVIDIENRKTPIEGVAKRLGVSFPPTLVHKTPRGYHYIYEGNQSKSIFKVLPDVDILTFPRWIYGPGSVVYKDKYTSKKNSTGRAKYSIYKERKIASIGTLIFEGNRNEAVHKKAIELTNDGLAFEDVLDEVTSWVDETHQGHMSKGEIKATVQSAFDWVHNEGGGPLSTHVNIIDIDQVIQDMAPRLASISPMASPEMLFRSPRMRQIRDIAYANDMRPETLLLQVLTRLSVSCGLNDERSGDDKRLTLPPLTPNGSASPLSLYTCIVGASGTGKSEVLSVGDIVKYEAKGNKVKERLANDLIDRAEMPTSGAGFLDLFKSSDDGVEHPRVMVTTSELQGITDKREDHSLFEALRKAWSGEALSNANSVAGGRYRFVPRGQYVAGLLVASTLEAAAKLCLNPMQGTAQRIIVSPAYLQEIVDVRRQIQPLKLKAPGRKASIELSNKLRIHLRDKQRQIKLGRLHIDTLDSHADLTCLRLAACGLLLENEGRLNNSMTVTMRDFVWARDGLWSVSVQCRNLLREFQTLLEMAEDQHKGKRQGTQAAVRNQTVQNGGDVNEEELVVFMETFADTLPKGFAGIDINKANSHKRKQFSRVLGLSWARSVREYLQEKESKK